jgi:hypothetical protein
MCDLFLKLLYQKNKNLYIKLEILRTRLQGTSQWSHLIIRLMSHGCELVKPQLDL